MDEVMTSARDLDGKSMHYYRREEMVIRDGQEAQFFYSSKVKVIRSPQVESKSKMFYHV